MRMDHEVVTKISASAETCKGNCYNQKRKFFYLYVVKTQAVEPWLACAVQNQHSTCKFASFMEMTTDILTLAYRHTPMQEQLLILYEKEQQMPGSVQYSIKRYQHNPQ